MINECDNKGFPEGFLLFSLGLGMIGNNCRVVVDGFLVTKNAE